MKIRLMGTGAECDAMLAVLRAAAGVEILESSPPYPNRGASGLVRVFVEARLDGAARDGGR